jgi:hypothetical protein
VTGEVSATSHIGSSAGSLYVVQAQSLWFGGLSAGSRIRQNASANLVFSRGGTDFLELGAGVLNLTATTLDIGEFNGATDPAAPADNRGRLYVRDNGAGKEQLCVRFNTGAVQVLATEP